MYVKRESYLSTIVKKFSILKGISRLAVSDSYSVLFFSLRIIVHVSFWARHDTAKIRYITQSCQEGYVQKISFHYRLQFTWKLKNKHT